MNKTEEIIKVAIEGDWMKPFIPKTQRAKDLWITLQSEPKAFKVAVCDPKFWQAIGKQKGLIGKFNHCEWKWNCMSCGKEKEFEQFYCNNCEKNVSLRQSWCWNALEFHRINLTQSFDDAINYLYELIK